MTAIVLLAIAVGIDNVAVSIGFGLTGLDRRAKVTVVALFGAFEGGMPVVGLLLGNRLAPVLGGAAAGAGGAALVAVAVWILIDNHRREQQEVVSPGLGPLSVLALALSLDNLVVGLGLGVSRPPLVTAVVVFAASGVVLTLLGLQVGSRLGRRFGTVGADVGAYLLVVVGVLVLLGVV